MGLISRVSSRTYRSIMFTTIHRFAEKVVEVKKSSDQRLNINKSQRRRIDWREERNQKNFDKSKKAQAIEAQLLQDRTKLKRSQRNILWPLVKTLGKFVGIGMGAGILVYLGYNATKTFRDTPASEYKKSPKQS